MKTLLITTIAICLGWSAFAQEDFNATAQGNYLVNGSLFINSTTSKTKLDGEARDDSKTFEVRASPRAGYFVIDNLAVGLDLFVQSSKTTFEGADTEVKKNGFSVGPFGRYYFGNGFFAEGTVGIGSSTTSSAFLPEDIKSSIFGWRVGGGYALFLGEHIALEPTIFYSRESQKAKDAPDNAPKNIVSSIFLGVGFTAYL
ncbi:outer membrane beta-barrel protein [Dokdonia sinensis]|nr:outer membrane beta-barrel protein [Dokdonia sinensis]